MQEASPDPLIGSTIDGRYLVLSKVAHGGMSTVYLATDLRLGRNIALKILHPHLATDSAFIERLGREAQSAASLSHPHVVQIHDHGVGPQHAYLVFEFIDGNTLRDVIRENGALSPRQALDLFDPIVEGLAAAHNAGLVHRDVKPENVLISRQGWVKIGDFGLSRAISTSTNTATLLGTVGYIAPELASGHGGDARSDIYSAGIMLYELLTGVQPFRGTMPVAVVMAHIQDDVPAPSLAVPTLPPVMDELVRYMTEKDPENRPANGAALLEDLRHIRQTLTLTELDAGASGKSASPTGSPSASPTEVITAATPASGPTGIIASPSFPTSVLPQPSRLYADGPHQSHQGDNAGSSGAYGVLQETSDAGPNFATGTGTGAYLGIDGQENTLSLSKRQRAAAAKSRAKAAATPQKTLGSKNPRRRALLWIMLVVVLAVIAATAGWFLALGPGALATVPDVHNKTVPQAQDILRTAGFGLTPTTDVFDEKVAAGFVVSTEPAAGESIRKFNGVTLAVSRGPILYAVPTLVGLQLGDAKQALSDAHLAVGNVTEAFDEKVATGVVLGQELAAGKEFRGNTKVNFSVSKGPKPIPVPSVTGQPQDQAVAALKAVGLVAAIAPEQANSASIPAGSVISASPESGDLKAGDSVTLTLSKGPRMIEVPSFVGKQLNVARPALEELGFKVEIKEGAFGIIFGTVATQNPRSGQHPEGTIITLGVV